MKKILALAVLLGTVTFAASAAVAGDSVGGSQPGPGISSTLNFHLMPAEADPSSPTGFPIPYLFGRDNKGRGGGNF